MYDWLMQRSQISVESCLQASLESGRSEILNGAGNAGSLGQDQPFPYIDRHNQKALDSSSTSKRYGLSDLDPKRDPGIDGRPTLVRSLGFGGHTQ
jgi:hypothetical protein